MKKRKVAYWAYLKISLESCSMVRVENLAGWTPAADTAVDGPAAAAICSAIIDLEMLVLFVTYHLLYCMSKKSCPLLYR